MHPTLKTKTAIVFKYSDLEKLVKEIYGVEVKILEDLISFERRGHYTYHHYTVDGESELDCIEDDETLARWIETGTYQMTKSEWGDYSDLDTGHILHRLFNDGHIEAGEYYMLVDW